MRLDVSVDCDLAVVGAGPAGAAAALRARQVAPGARVVLIDKARFPRDKACGDAIGPAAVELLERLGVADRVLEGYPPVDRVRITAPDGSVVAGHGPRAGHVVPRRRFDARLRRAALAAGAEAVDHRVGELEPVDGGVRVDDLLQARWVVGADGANSVVRRAVGVGRQSRATTGLAMRGYAPADGLDELRIGFVGTRWPAYVWAFPTGRGGCNVGYGSFDARKVDSRRDLVGVLEERAPCPPDPDSLRAHHLPLSTERPALVHGRVLLAGDAASLINPITGEGIAHALLSGALAGAAAVGAPERAGEVYPRALHSRIGRHLRHTSGAARMMRWQPSVTLVIRAADRDPAVFAELCEFALGTAALSGRTAASVAGTGLAWGWGRLRGGGWWGRGQSQSGASPPGSI